jgi:predicted AlkP superfamily phosphohydrolase/phosphomutase
MKLTTLLIGLDGATFDVLDPLMDAGVMPHLKRVMDGGVRATLRSTVPALTPPAWTSLVTGHGPGTHGIFDFFRKDSPSSQHFGLLTSRDVDSPPIWSLATDAGLQSTILNFPLTFPPPRIKGHVLPGGFMPWRQMRLGCHPPEMFDRLRELPGFNPRELALDMSHEAKAIEGCPDEEYESWIDLHIRRERQWVDILRYLRHEDPSDFTALLFDGVDKIQHLCWRFVDPAWSASLTSAWDLRIREKVREYFAELDKLIGELADLFPDDTTIVVASDHGFGPQVRTFFVNSWLAQKGYLTWQDPNRPADAPATSLGLGQLARHVYKINWTRTCAFAPLPSGNGIHIVRQDEAHPAGVPDHEYRRFREQLAAGLKEVVDPETGEAVVKAVWTRDEIFSGPNLELAPDLTLELQDGGLISILDSPYPVRRRPCPAGTHRPDGVLAMTGPGLRQGVQLEPLSILDVAPSMLFSLDLPLSSDLEGRLIPEMFRPEALSQRPPRWTDPVSAASSTGEAAVVTGEAGDTVLDAEAEAEILKRLQALGYVE